jgi:DNA-binding transcriptional ArsR family regulator
MSVFSPVQGSTTPTCSQSHSLDSEELTPLQGIILAPEKAQRMAEFFSLLGDYNRLRILSLLAKRELCVCDLATVLGMSESAVSHQLRILRAMRLVKYHKIGRKVFYHLCDHHVLDLYRSVAEHLDEPNEDE